MGEASALRLRLFGCWTLTDGDGLIPVASRGQRVVALLALRGRHPRVMLAGTLWPEADELRAQASLRAALSTLNRQVPGLVQAENGDVRLAASLAVDVQEFRDTAHRVLSGPLPEDAAAFDVSTAMGGELLPGWPDQWAQLEREHLRHVRLHVLEALSARLAGRGDYADALAAAFKAVEIDPLRESARRCVVQVHLAEGNVAAAVHEYERFRTTLRHELDVEPTSRITELIYRATQPAQR